MSGCYLFIQVSVIGFKLQFRIIGPPAQKAVFEMADSKYRRHGAYEGRETVSMAFDRPEVYARREKDENYSFYAPLQTPSRIPLNERQVS